jgi:hypothetical protein
MFLEAMDVRGSNKVCAENACEREIGSERQYEGERERESGGGGAEKEI